MGGFPAAAVTRTQQGARLHSWRQTSVRRNTALLIGMEFVMGPTLSQWLSDVGDDRRLCVCASFARHLLLALQAMHRHGVPHGALAPDSLTVTSGNVLKVSDFPLSGHCQSLNYAAPEFSGTLPADIFSAAVIILEMFTPLREEVLSVADFLIEKLGQEIIASASTTPAMEPA